MTSQIHSIGKSGINMEIGCFKPTRDHMQHIVNEIKELLKETRFEIKHELNPHGLRRNEGASAKKLETFEYMELITEITEAKALAQILKNVAAIEYTERFSGVISYSYATHTVIMWFGERYAVSEEVAEELLQEIDKEIDAEIKNQTCKTKELGKEVEKQLRNLEQNP